MMLRNGVLRKVRPSMVRTQRSAAHGLPAQICCVNQDNFNNEAEQEIAEGYLTPDTCTDAAGAAMSHGRHWACHLYTTSDRRRGSTSTGGPYNVVRHLASSHRVPQTGVGWGGPD
ncbi:uncharacterized protein ColSpa_09899 [Colletotrichum spaethianum]|uniref:Uncharacterized protein n=1 Tax=Colletotrichum spaethianum TaxID=700344 RepID=A0AA37PCF3_9PEZI|nr:uncharacterized protein ColSpa_09899 [Colletotrichum spaethianum]GKT49718.1 hypothetical protein ColSpa_09899 [Colletotrichum spaethianum]